MTSTMLGRADRKFWMFESALHDAPINVMNNVMKNKVYHIAKDNMGALYAGNCFGTPLQLSVSNSCQETWNLNAAKPS